MMEIVGKGKKKELWVDGAFFCIINDFLILKYKLPNDSLQESKLLEIKNEAEIELGFGLAVDYVSRGSKTEKQVKDYLQKKLSPSNAEVVLEKMRGYGYVNDLEFAKNFADSKRSTCGKNKIKLLLMQKGVAKHTIDKVLCDFSSANLIGDVARKYMRAKEPTRENLAKLSRHLFTKGFTYDEINLALHNYKEKTDESWD